MATISISAPGAGGFLYNSGHNTARLCVTAETPDFDTSLLRRWQDEGLDVQYVPFNGGGKEYILRLKSVKEGLGVGENYAVVAFGDAASFCLDYYIKPTTSSRLCALIAYYPTNIPDPRMRFPPTLRVMTHLAGSTVDVTTTPTMLGLQGKRRTNTRQINPGLGSGERLNIGHLAYTYEHAQPGFAETDLDEYDRLASELAWSRSLQMLRKGFGKDPDIEEKWEEHLEARFFSMNLSDTMAPYTNHVAPTVTFTPTVSGGIGTHALRRFYEHHFLQKLPPSMRLRLISRTQGTDRVVDELFVSFQHTHEIPWMLPGVPPTDKHVEIVLVSIVSLRAGRLYSEHVYWDQASVLVQVGLLDPKLVPQGASPSVDRLPVVGREAARRMLQEDPELDGKDFHNRLIRRARAKAKGKDGEPQTPAVEESGAEGKSELDTPLKEPKGKGKAVQQESRQAGPQPDTEAEEENGEEEAQNGEQNGHSNEKKGMASVEDAQDDGE
ncbi:dienelactone hydrolase [Aspergillus steynii IBT 23096]|uniref:Dienelactone hydrolase n=1 Tax=Aspergillus steynii IBT 23096 TaxID=1392250 RepID=A0A2I2GCN5_9EURO|nr:dienelactone hydrolase [Aspergillus steynii IBT 23096]PLB50643.1 dienelactone hydrolase [Aspergillus steynii IBT 23096]